MRNLHSTNLLTFLPKHNDNNGIQWPVLINQSIRHNENFLPSFQLSSSDIGNKIHRGGGNSVPLTRERWTLCDDNKIGIERHKSLLGLTDKATPRTRGNLLFHHSPIRRFGLEIEFPKSCVIVPFYFFRFIILLWLVFLFISSACECSCVPKAASVWTDCATFYVTVRGIMRQKGKGQGRRGREWQ